MASSTALCALNTLSSPLTQIASLREAAPAGPPLTGASSMCAPFAANAALSFFTTAGALVDRSNQAAPGLMPARSPSGPSPTASTSGGSGSDVKMTSHWLGRARGLARPDRASLQVMACGLAMQVVDHEFEARLLQVGGHPAAHGAETDETDRHVVFGHGNTLAVRESNMRAAAGQRPQLPIGVQN